MPKRLASNYDILHLHALAGIQTRTHGVTAQYAIITLLGIYIITYTLSKCLDVQFSLNS